MNRAIIFGTKSKIVRRIIVSDNDQEFDDECRNRVAGESIYVVPHPFPFNHHEAKAIIGSLHAIDPDSIPSGRCAVVVDGVVKHIIHADPAIDAHADGSLVLHDLANVGDVLGAP